MIEKTLVIIKPDSMSKGCAGDIIAMIEKNGFQINALKMKHLTRAEAEEFYAEHRGKAFYEPLVSFMSSNPAIVLAVSGENAIMGIRALLGKTDPADAAPGTIRKLFGTDGRHNAVHGSDSPKSAEREIGFYFTKDEIHEWAKREYRK